MRETEEDPHERLKQLYSDLKQEWDSMKTDESSTTDSSSIITVEKALRFLENSPRRLMLHLQVQHHDDDDDDDDATCPRDEERQIKGRKLFVDSDDDGSSSFDQESKVRSVLYDASAVDNHRRKPFEKPSRNDGSDKAETQSRFCRSRGFVVLLFVVVSVWVSIVFINGCVHSEMGGTRTTLVPT